MTALHRFLILRKEKNIKLILEKGASVIPATKCGNTALHLAAMRNNTSILDMLLNYDADTNSVTDIHPIPLGMGACQWYIPDRR